MSASTATNSTAAKDPQRPDVDHAAGQDFVYDVDGTTYHHDRPKITGAEIMLAAGIPASDGLVQILEDGSTATVSPDDEVYLVPGAKFKRRPKFKRG
ncbi:MAG: multiubiquitin domain-containing protein [Actinomycetota bacterium]|nr:multiubiquitin domain-containing protein [Actinomycetota bacterium]